MNKITNILVVAVLLTFVVVGVQMFSAAQRLSEVQGNQLGAVSNYLDTSASQITHTTSTITVTSTNIWSGITKFGEIKNVSAVTVHCSLDARGTTPASSTVRIDRGIVIEPASSTWNYAQFGECYPGSQHCYPHKGAVNCLATGTGILEYFTK